MIRDAVLHLLGEQPLVADLPAMPSPGDLALHCTNLRTLDRKRPVFVDHMTSTFIIPFAQIRFVEIVATTPDAAEAPTLPALASAVTEEIELDEELLRRVRDL